MASGLVRTSNPRQMPNIIATAEAENTGEAYTTDVTREGWEIGRIRARVNLVKNIDKASGSNTFYCNLSFSEKLKQSNAKIA